jgi:DNA-binding NarL/FixJ family response regulator
MKTRTIRTFLAEDSPFFMAFLARVVSKDQRVSLVGSATDGQKALSNVPALRPDLVVMDLHMPRMDGAEATRRMKRLPAPPFIFIVTSDDTPETRARCLAAGADAFLVKAGKLAPGLLSTIQEFFPEDLGANDNELEPLHETLTTVT